MMVKYLHDDDNAYICLKKTCFLYIECVMVDKIKLKYIRVLVSLLQQHTHQDAFY